MSTKKAEGTTADARSTNSIAALDWTSRTARARVVHRQRVDPRDWRQHLDGLRPGEDVFDHVGRRVQDVLAVVEDEQSNAALQSGRDAIGEAQPRSLRDAEYRGDRFRQYGGSPIAASSITQTPSGKELASQLRAQVPAVSSDAADSGEGHQPMRSPHSLQLGQLRVAADKARGW